MSIKVITKFPDMYDFSYNYREWNRQFVEQNIILNGRFSYLFYPEHWTTLSLKFAFGGIEQYILGDMKYSVESSHYLILNRDTMYKSLISSHKPVESLTLNFTSEFAEDVFYSSFNNDEYLLDYPEVRDRHPVNFFQKLYRSDPHIQAMVNSLREKVKNSSADTALLNEFLHSILEHTFRTQLTESKLADSVSSIKRSTRVELYSRLCRARDYMTSNFTEPVDLNKLASIACLCPHHFLRKFKSSFGVSPHKFLTAVRLDHAKKMLEETSLSVTEICLSCGYESLSAFGELFRKSYGLWPDAYRKDHTKKVNFQII